MKLCTFYNTLFIVSNMNMSVLTRGGSSLLLLQSAPLNLHQEKKKSVFTEKLLMAYSLAYCNYDRSAERV